MADFENGQTIKLTATFKNSAGSVATPTTITLKLKNPAGTITTYTYADSQLTLDSTGVLSYTFQPTASGNWQYRFASTGTPATATEGEIYIRPTGFA